MKQPFAIQNPKLRSFLLDFAVLLNHAEKYDWNPFSNEAYERLMTDMLEKRKENLFQRFYREEQKAMVPFLEDMVINLTSSKADADITSKLMNEQNLKDDEKFCGRIMYTSSDNTNIHSVEYRIKSANSFWMKFVRTLRDKKYKESRRNDFLGIRLIWEAPEAREYIKNTGWNDFSAETIKYIIKKTNALIKKRTDHIKEHQSADPKHQNYYKPLLKDYKALNKRSFTEPKRCEELCNLLSTYHVALRDEPGYHELVREIDLARTYANLTESAKKNYVKNFKNANNSIIMKSVSDMIDSHLWTTLPYGPVVMQVYIPKRQSLEKEAAIQSQVVMARTRKGTVTSYDIDYMLFNTTLGADEFVSRLDTKAEEEKFNHGVVLYGTREHAEGRLKNFALFRQANLVVYASFDGPIDTFREFMSFNPESGEQLKDIITRKFRLAEPLMTRLDKTTNDEILSGKKKTKDKKSIYETRRWQKNIYDLQKKVIKNLLLKENELEPRFALFLDTFRADITSKFKTLGPVNNKFKNMAVFLRDFLIEPKEKSGYEAVQLRICLDLGTEKTENKETGIEIQNLRPDAAYEADRGKAAHNKYKDVEWRLINPAVASYGELLLGDDESAFNKFYNGFHSNRITINLKKSLKMFRKGDDEMARACLDRSIESYHLLINRTEPGAKRAAAEGAVALRKILFDYISKDSLYAYSDLISGSDKTRIRSLQRLIKEELNLLSEQTRADLNFVDIDGLLTQKERLYSDFCDAAVETAGNIADFLASDSKIKSEYGVKVLAYSMLKDYPAAVPHLDEQSAADEQKYKQTMQQIKDILNQAEMYVEKNWNKVSGKTKYSCITMVPFQIKPYKLRGYMTQGNIEKFLGRVDNSAARLCIDYLRRLEGNIVKAADS